MPEFSLIETLCHDPGTGFVRLELHLARLAHSARRLGFPDTGRVAAALVSAVRSSVSRGSASRLRVRLTFGASGEIDVTTVPLPVRGSDWNVRIARTRLLSSDPLLCMKTTRRGVYDEARGEYTVREADEVILLNERGEVCEGTVTSVFLDDGTGILRTPPLSSGLLAGVLRADLIVRGEARVSRLSVDDLATGRLFVGNSLRGLIPVTLR